MPQFMNALKENCVIDHLKELDYAFLSATKATVIFDFLIEKNRESLETIKCDTSKALVDAAQKNIVFPHLKEVSYNNKTVSSLKDLSKSISIPSTESCQSLATSPIEGSNTMSLAAWIDS